MRKINQWYRQLPNSGATVLALFAAITGSILVSFGAGLVVVLLWYRDTRTDGLAAFLVVSLAVGLLVSVLVFLTLAALHGVTSAKFAFIPPVLWLGTAIAFTWQTCRGEFITLDNWLWVLRSGDPRSYVLDWIIRGWIAILVSVGLSILLGGRTFHRLRAR